MRRVESPVLDQQTCNISKVILRADLRSRPTHQPRKLGVRARNVVDVLARVDGVILRSLHDAAVAMRSNPCSIGSAKLNVLKETVRHPANGAPNKARRS